VIETKLSRAGSTVLGAPVLEVVTSKATQYKPAAAPKPTILPDENPYFIPDQVYQVPNGALAYLTTSVTALLVFVFATLF